MIKLNLPTSESEIRKLKIGDEVLLSGLMVTGRDAAHTFLTKEMRPEYKKVLEGTCIYHCGPIVAKDKTGWRFVAAGPTTSIREEPYEATVIKNYGVRGIIGKGGMGQKTLDALKECGAVYFHAVGGAAAALAEKITKVPNVFLLEEFGVPEAIWQIEVKDFPVVVTMDSHGNSLHKTVKEGSDKRVKEMLGI